MNNLPARTGWDWLKQGGALFRKQPLALTTLLFANILFSIGMSALPILGPVLAVILIPSFSMAFMQACLMIENGERVTPAVLLTGFRQPALAALCKAGLIYLAVSIVLMFIMRVAVPTEFMEQMAAASADNATPPNVAPLTYWKNMGPGKATFYSFFAVLRAAGPFFVMLAAWFALFFGLCMLVALLFGNANAGRVVIMWLIFLFVLLLQCAMYAGYTTIFGKPVHKGSAVA